MSVTLMYRADGWKRKLPEKGYRWYLGEGDDRHLVEWKDTAQYLNGAGYKLAEGEEVVTTDPLPFNKIGTEVATFLATIQDD